MKIAIYTQQYIESYNSVFADLWRNFDISDEIYIEEKLFKSLKARQLCFPSAKSFNSNADLDTSFDLMLTIGGDGTFLRSITYVRNLNIPILGINVGRLGFLAMAHKEKIADTILALRRKEYRIEERSVLEVVDYKTKLPIDDINFALNEISVTRRNTASMITIDTQLNGEFLTSYWADGLILSTPTGSTGYSLSCGGPVILPNAKNFVVTPIAPHNLNARPLVIPDDMEITLCVSGRERSYLVTLDSHIKSLPNQVPITIRKAAFSIKVIRFNENSFIHTLRNKLLWGEDKRNV